MTHTIDETIDPPYVDDSGAMRVPDDCVAVHSRGMILFARWQYWPGDPGVGEDNSVEILGFSEPVLLDIEDWEGWHPGIEPTQDTMRASVKADEHFRRLLKAAETEAWCAIQREGRGYGYRF